MVDDKELDEWIARYGSEREALRAILDTLEVLHMEIYNCQMVIGQQRDIINDFKEKNKMKTFDDLVNEYNDAMKIAWERSHTIGHGICEALKGIIPDLIWYVNAWEQGIDTINFELRGIDYSNKWTGTRETHVPLGDIIVKVFSQFDDEVTVDAHIDIPKELVPQIRERLLTLKNSFVEMEDEK